MKTKFFEYYEPSKEQFDKLWNEALFVFDSNILLNLYRYSEDTRNKLLKILEEISKRIWIPHQFAFEYQKNRLEEIKKQNNSYSDILIIIDEGINKIKRRLEKYQRHPVLDMKRISNEIEEKIKKIKEEISNSQIESHPNWFEKDTIRIKITQMFDSKVGQPYDNEKLKEIYKEGRERYQKFIPPGYKDQKKDGVNIKDSNKYGDLIGWFQIIDKANVSKKPIIFICDDKKEDWWEKQNGTIGPRPELIREIHDKTNVSFYMYSSDKFMEYAKEQFKIEIDDKIIKEVKELRESNEKQSIPVLDLRDKVYYDHFDKMILKDTLKDSEIKSYLINNWVYEIKCTSISSKTSLSPEIKKFREHYGLSDSEATFSVNGENFILREGESYKLIDGMHEMGLFSLNFSLENSYAEFAIFRL